jgi:ketosteroid isomerase-like protein
MRVISSLTLPTLMLGGFMLADGPVAAPTDEAATVAALDTRYQAAVRDNDWATMDVILADDFVLVTGNGTAYRKADLIEAAKRRTVEYEHQEDLTQTVRVWGNTAVVTALLWEKGTSGGQSFEKRLWFSDTYVRTSAGWKYVFGQASLPLPKG